MLDKNTANYSLKIFALGTVKEVRYDSGESFHFKAVGFLSNTILQGSLLMSEQDFLKAFPEVAGYQYFLIDDGDVEFAATQSASVKTLEDRLSDLGFDARSAPKLLANFMKVQNTYLSTFQTLGALGLLLGTFGLATVQVRSVLERKQQLGLLRAIGFELASAFVASHAGERLVAADRFSGRDWIGVVDNGTALVDRCGFGSLAGVACDLYQYY